MTADLVIKNGLVCTECGTIRGGLAIKDGIIVSIGADVSLPEGTDVYDAKGNFIFPGIIEPHCHFGVNREYFDRDIYTETRTAAQGGITTVCSTTSQSGLSMKKRLEEAKKPLTQAFTDVRYHISPFTDENLEEIPGMLEEGVTSFKFLLAYRGEGARVLDIDERGIDSTYIYRGFEQIAKAGKPALAMLHCEDPEIFEYTEKKVQAEGIPPYQNYIDAMNRSRPAIAEAVDLCKAALIAKELQVPIYMVHVSAKESVDLIQYFKQKGCEIVAETCPHYLLFAAEDRICIENEEWTRFAKVNPPIRNRADRERLWQGLREGTITTIGTDHTHYDLNMKKDGSFWEIPPGTGDGMSASLSIMLTEGVNKGRISMETLRKVMSENIAKAMGMYPQKGVLAVGSDADVTIIDLNKEWTFTNICCETAHRYSLYEGMKMKGAPVATFVRGSLVAENFQIVSDTPTGRFVDSHIPWRPEIK